MALAALLAFTAAASAQAQAQTPGRYRMMLGKLQVKALSDGTVARPVDKLLQTPKAGLAKRLLARAYR